MIGVTRRCSDPPTLGVRSTKGRNTRTVSTTTTEELPEQGSGLRAELTKRLGAVVDRGRSGSEELVMAQRRRTLFRKLGELTYQAHVEDDDAVGRSGRDELLAELDEMAQAGQEYSES